MQVVKALRFRVRDTPALRAQLGNLVGCRRWAWNWGVEHCQAHYAATEKHLSLGDLDKQFTVVRTATPWLQSISKWVPRLALRDLDQAYKMFFKSRRENMRRPDGRLMFEAPTFHKRSGRGSFRIPQSQGSLRVVGDAINVPKLGLVRFRKSRPVVGDILAATVSQEAGKWFVSIQVRQEVRVRKGCGPPVGLDLGISNAVATSGGELFPGPRFLQQDLEALRRAQRALSRKMKGSQNRRKAALRVARLHQRVKNQRRDFQSKLVATICKSHAIVFIEDLDVQGMIRRGSRGLRRGIMDAAMAGFANTLESRAAWFGSRVIRIGRFTPTSKVCNSCRHEQGVPLAMRTYSCQACGVVADRDVNAARNVLAAGLAASACGVNVRLGRKAEQLAGKQEAHGGDGNVVQAVASG